MPLSFSLDHVGPLAANVADAAVVLQAIAGYDAADVTSEECPVADYMGAMREDVKKFRVGVARQYFFDDLDPEVASAMEHALHGLQTLVAEMKEVQLDVPTDRTLQMAESYAYHSESAKRTPELYKPETLRRILAGEKISAGEYIHHRRALQAERRSIVQAFGEVDLLITPTTPMTAPKIADLTADPDALRPAEIKLLRNTRPFNVWGLPAISIPCGSDENGLPIGLQIAGPPWSEHLVLQLAHAIEQMLARSAT